MESRTQGSRPRTQKNPRPRPRTAFPRTDTLEAKDRIARGQGPRTQAQVRSPKKKKGLRKNFSGDLKKKKKKRFLQKFFKRSPRKNVFQKIFHALYKILTIQKILLSSSRGQANFRGLEASRPRPRTSKSVLEDSISANQCDTKLKGKLTAMWFFAQVLKKMRNFFQIALKLLLFFSWNCKYRPAKNRSSVSVADATETEDLGWIQTKDYKTWYKYYD